MDSMEDALRRLRLLEDEQAIVRTLYKYCHSLDAGRHQDWLGCFTDDVEYEVRYPNPPDADRVARGRREGSSVHHRGREQMAAFVEMVTRRRPTGTRKHMIVEPRIEIDGDTATGVTYYFTVDNVDQAPEVLTFGRYLDRYRRGAGGEWLIAARVVDTDAQRPTPA
jgi:3-phenylpropionate/cinnamic acid dioxygenase small subunit